VSEPKVLTATYETRLARPVEEVWAFLTDVENTPRWRTRMDVVRWLEPGRTFEVVSSFGPWRKLAMKGEVTASEPPHRFAYRITEGPLKAHNEYVLEPDGDGTRFVMSGGAGMDSWVVRLAAPVLRWGFGRTTKKELARLSRILD
jgi:uncharacterized protein YndB with AHSA1/START domain